MSSDDESQDVDASAEFLEQLATEVDAGIGARLEKKRAEYQARQRVTARLIKAALTMFLVNVISFGLMLYTESIVWGVTFAVSLLVSAVLFGTLFICGEVAPPGGFNPEEAVAKAVVGEIFKRR